MKKTNTSITNKIMPWALGLGFKEIPDTSWNPDCFYRAVLHEGGQIIKTGKKIEYTIPNNWDEKKAGIRIHTLNSKDSQVEEFFRSSYAQEMLIAETISISEAANRLGLSEIEIRSGAINGRYGALCFNRMWRISKYHIETLIHHKGAI